MDDKASRREKIEKYMRRKQVQMNRRKLWDFLQTHKYSLYTIMMLSLTVLLLFAICIQLKPPTLVTSPAGQTSVDYSTFIKQVKDDRVLAVTIRGTEINGLLVKSSDQNLSSSQKRPPSSATSSSVADYSVWSRSAGGTTVGATSSSSLISSDRAIYTQIPSGGDNQLVPLLVQHHVLVNTQPVSNTGWWATIWKFLPFLLAVVCMFIFLAVRSTTRTARPADDRISQMGKSRARRFMPASSEQSPSAVEEKKAFDPKKTTLGKNTQNTKPLMSKQSSVTFADVAGIDEVRTELEEIVQFLRTPQRYDRLGARIPRGALLVGPPGTGKTLLAKAVAGEAGVPFFSMSASEFVEMFVGVGASRVRDLFSQARQASPCVIFIDEIDAVGRKRSMRMSGNDERDQTLNQLLVELDGFNPRQAVVVLAATNRVDILDKALLRPGRFDRRITVSLPDRVGREAILKVHTRNTPLAEDVHLERLSRLTTGMSGADLANLVNEAALSAARLDLERVTNECFEQALARVQLGALRPLVMSEREQRIIAYHEGGHALVAYHLPEADSVNRVTILPRGQSLGVTHFVAEEDRYNYSRQALMARIAVGLGGRVAEELTFGSENITTGAENDLQVVTDLARKMVTRWGMSEQVGLVFADYKAESEYALNMRRINPNDLSMQSRSVVMETDGTFKLNGQFPPRSYAYEVPASAPRNSGVVLSAVVDAEVQRIIQEGREMAHRLLKEHADQLKLLADALMEHEQLDRTQFEALFQREGE